MFKNIDFAVQQATQTLLSRRNIQIEKITVKLHFKMCSHSTHLSGQCVGI